MEQLIDFALIGKRIKASRKKARITQAQLAEKLGISVAYMSQIETGKTKISLSRLAQIAKFLQTDPSYFLAGTTPGTNHYFI